MFCSNCGHEFNSNQNFCSNCGAQKVSVISKKQKPTMSEEHKLITHQICNVSDSSKRSLEEYHFQMTEKPIVVAFGIVYFSLTFLFGIALTIFFGLMVITNEMSLLVALVAVGGLLGFFVIVGIVVLVFMILVAKKVNIDGKTIKITSKMSKRKYDCSEIKKIACGVFTTKNGGLSYVSLIFNDGKGYVYDWDQGNPQLFAEYLLKIHDMGVIAEDAITSEDIYKLNLLTKGIDFKKKKGSRTSGGNG